MWKVVALDFVAVVRLVSKSVKLMVGHLGKALVVQLVDEMVED